MDGWTGQILRVNLTNGTHRVETFSEEFATTWIGGRGFAVKILYDELAPGIDPLGPDNKLVVAVGPISGIPAPNTGKTIVAAKSPATGGYGDGNLGTRVTDQLRKAGYDALIIEGRAERPTMLVIDDDRVELQSAEEIWGKGTIETNDWIYARYNKGVGVLNIGPAGEHMVNYAVIRSLEGRSGGRPGMGAVMGSKLLKAIVVKGSKPIPQAFPAKMKELGRDDLREVHQIDKDAAWSQQGTTGVLPWCNEVAALPVHNFRGTSHPDAWRWTVSASTRLVSPRTAARTARCAAASRCSMTRAASPSSTTSRSGSLGRTSTCTTSPRWRRSTGCATTTGSTRSPRAPCSGSTRMPSSTAQPRASPCSATWPPSRSCSARSPIARVRSATCSRTASLRAARAFGHGSEDYAMQVKGLEISAYNCKFIPGMALAFGVSPIGAHHKESWIITYEVNQTPRESYDRDKAQKVVDLQRIRGGLFESLITCRFPWVEVGWGVEHYPIYFNTITGKDWKLEDFWPISDRIYALIKLFWLREYPETDRTADYPPAVWFDPANADTEGPIAGRILERDKYDSLLQHYYDIRGYDVRGVPTRATLESLGLGAEAAAAEAHATLL